MTTQNNTTETTLASVLTNVVTITTTKRDNIELTEDDLQRVTGGGVRAAVADDGKPQVIVGL